MQTPDDVRGLAEELGTSAWAFAVLCSAAESGLLTSLREPQQVTEAAAQTALPAPLVARMLDVLVTLGLAWIIHGGKLATGRLLSYGHVVND